MSCAVVLSGTGSKFSVLPIVFCERVNAYLKTQQCVATTIWYSYFSYTILSYGLQLREHWPSIHPEKGWLLRCLGLILQPLLTV